jgi:hypothetical protein
MGINMLFGNMYIRPEYGLGGMDEDVFANNQYHNALQNVGHNNSLTPDHIYEFNAPEEIVLYDHHVSLWNRYNNKKSEREARQLQENKRLITEYYQRYYGPKGITYAPLNFRQKTFINISRLFLKLGNLLINI